MGVFAEARVSFSRFGGYLVFIGVSRPRGLGSRHDDHVPSLRSLPGARRRELGQYTKNVHFYIVSIAEYVNNIAFRPTRIMQRDYSSTHGLTIDDIHMCGNRHMSQRRSNVVNTSESYDV